MPSEHLSHAAQSTTDAVPDAADTVTDAVADAAGAVSAAVADATSEMAQQSAEHDHTTSVMARSLQERAQERAASAERAAQD